MLARQLKVRWSPQDMGLPHFLNDYRNKLPVIVSVSSGYYGNSAVLHTFSSDEVHVVCGVQTQHRVVLKDDQGKLLSVPLDHRKHRFQEVEKHGTLGEPLFLAEHVDKIRWTGRCPKLIFEGDPRVDFTEGASHEMTFRLGELDYHDDYDESYLVAYPLMPSYSSTRKPAQRCTQHVPIPVYMDIRFAVAEGMENGTHEDLVRMTRQFLPEGDVDFDSLPIPMNSDIMQIPKGTSKEAYMTISPDKILNLGIPPGPLELEHPYPEVDMPAMIDSGLYGTTPAVPPRKPITPQKPTPPVVPPKPEPIKQGASGNLSTSIITQLNRLFTTSKGDAAKEGVPRASISPTRRNPPMMHGLGTVPTTGIPPVGTAPMTGNPPGTAPMTGNPPVSTAPSVGTAPMVSNKPIGMAPGIRNPPPDMKRLPVGTVPITTKPPGGAGTSKMTGDPEDDDYEPVDGIQKAPLSSPGTATTSEQNSQTKYTSLEDVPKDISGLSLTQISQCLSLLGMPQHIRSFRNNLVDGVILQTLDADLLHKDLNFKQIEAKRLVEFVKGWRPNVG